jgi:ATP-dependent protease ClpP protease subunit
VQWIPPRWDWVDPLKDIQAQVLAMEAGITSRRKVVEATGYDIEEVDRENAADAARAAASACATARAPARRRARGRRRRRGPIPATAPANDTVTAPTRPIRHRTGVTTWRSWYAIRARGTGAEVAIYDEIGAYGVSAKGFLAELGALPEGTPVDLRLNSPGGSVFDAVAIHNALKRHEGTVTVWIDGIAASAASYVAMAGDEIVMPENAFLMIHDPSGLVMGTAGDMRAMAEALDKVKGSLVSGYAAPAGRPRTRSRRSWRPRPGSTPPTRWRQGFATADRARAHRRALRHRPLPQRAAGADRGGWSSRSRPTRIRTARRRDPTSLKTPTMSRRRARCRPRSRSPRSGHAAG